MTKRFDEGDDRVTVYLGQSKTPHGSDASSYDPVEIPPRLVHGSPRKEENMCRLAPAHIQKSRSVHPNPPNYEQQSRVVVHAHQEVLAWSQEEGMHAGWYGTRALPVTTPVL